MQSRSFAVAVTLLFLFTFDNHGIGVPMQSAAREQEQERAFLQRRENFKSGRELLLTKRVPFDPDELLRDGWTEKLKNSLDSMPEMHETHLETAPLNGAYLADTVYLPENVQLSNHTIILAKYIVFEGKNPVIKGNYDLHFFPMQPVAVLGTTLSEAFHEKPGMLNVKLGRKAGLPSFSLIRSFFQLEKHVITFDVSGPQPEFLRSHPSKNKASVRTASWNGSGFIPAQKQCSVSCSDNGGVGATGAPGTAGPPGNAGDSQPRAANGSCTGIINGSGGAFGGDGNKGGTGGIGLMGGTGGKGGSINVFIQDNDTNKYVFMSNGGQGGMGGTGGDAGIGGNGGRGGDGGDGVACDCQNIGEGGNAGHGGGAGKGGDAGSGGQGGMGGSGGTITGSYPFNGTPPDTFFAGGLGGPAGAGGVGGVGGAVGQPGNPGKGASACGKTASDGGPNVTGSGGDSGSSGNGGTNGPPGADGSSMVIPRQPSGGGGGGVGITDPCLGGQVDLGSGFTSGGSVGPTCSPIIVDTVGDGFSLTSAQTGVMFDISGSGHPIQLAWTQRGAHSAFLGLPGADGLIHNGKQLFGNFTPQPASAHPNGFLALAEFDKAINGGNGDGIIDDRDAVFSRLRLWIDENHDGVCQVNELHTLPELGVFSLALKYVESRRTDDFGNQFRYRAKVNPDSSDGDSDVGRWTYDVFLTTVPNK